jgi:hypothetical protein
MICSMVAETTFTANSEEKGRCQEEREGGVE